MPKDLPNNPFRPGAGHSPPFLAGRESEVAAFRKFLAQTEVVKNVILTGLRGVGKTVLMDDRFKAVAQADGWAWVGSDFSEPSFLTEENLCNRLITDLSIFSSSLSVATGRAEGLGFDVGQRERRTLGYDFLMACFDAQPGLMADKLKGVLELVWKAAERKGVKGIVFAYDEAQVVSDHKSTEQYPLAILLESFQSLQRRGARYLLLLTGLPTLFPRLVESRTYAERMFSVQEIGRLTQEASREAIEIPLEGHDGSFSEDSIKRIIEVSDGYPYFIQFICREAYDFVKVNPGESSIPIEPIIRKLDADFFAGRWEILSDRQRDLLYCVARIAGGDGEFTIPEIVASSLNLAQRIKPFSRNDVSQILPRLIEKGLVYKNRYGRYCFAVPLFAKFIRRRYDEPHHQHTLDR